MDTLRLTAERYAGHSDDSNSVDARPRTRRRDETRRRMRSPSGRKARTTQIDRGGRAEKAAKAYGEGSSHHEPTRTPAHVGLGLGRKHRSIWIERSRAGRDRHRVTVFVYRRRWELGLHLLTLNATFGAH
jgi:hypothetical protein